MQKIISELSLRRIFTIKELSLVLGKKTQTIRKWEQKGIIPKCKNYSSNGWREYSKNEFADILEIIINYPWERKTIHNIGYIQYLINILRMEA